MAPEPPHGTPTLWPSEEENKNPYKQRDKSRSIEDLITVCILTLNYRETAAAAKTLLLLCVASEQLAATHSNYFYWSHESSKKRRAME